MKLRRRVRLRRRAAAVLAPLIGAAVFYSMLVLGVMCLENMDFDVGYDLEVIAGLTVFMAFGSAWSGLRAFRRLRGRRWNWLPPKPGLDRGVRAYVLGASTGLLLTAGVPVGAFAVLNPDSMLWPLILTIPVSIGAAPTAGVMVARWALCRRTRARKTQSPPASAPVRPESERPPDGLAHATV